jgi:23S rRNA (cytosine1962-C5)-methyltransferase
MENSSILQLVEQALQARLPFLKDDHSDALRLFNGFYEGFPDLSVDLFASTLVFFNYADQPAELEPFLQAALTTYLTGLPWLKAVLVKTRQAADPAARRGILIFGERPDEQICEDGIQYAIDLQMNQDASFYLDTQLLRQWLLRNSAGKSVLNTFAYTGSLGVAALAGGAATVLQTDLNPRFLDLARRSAALNADLSGRHVLRQGDFFRIAGALRQQDARFDTVIVDAPFFSQTHAGQVDLVQQSTRLINKIRPLVAHNGRLVAINNALFLSGAAYLDSLNQLCRDGYMEIETLLAVPLTYIGYAQDLLPHLPEDPAPFNHPTKIAILRLSRKL